MRFRSKSADGETEIVDTVSEDTELQQALHEYATNKALAEKYAKAAKEASEKLTKVVDREGGTALVRNGDKVFKVTRVAPEKVVIDDEAFIRIYGKRAWNKLSKRVLDRTLFEEAVQRGEVKPHDLAIICEVKAITPHARVTEQHGVLEGE